MKKILNKTINIISVILVSVVICSMPLTNTSSALTYSDEVDVQFTFNPTVSISLSSPNLLIDDLSPGNSSDSNIITVTTNTNSSVGFVLTASVGDGTHLGPSYNNTNLNHSNNTNVFTSIATNSDLTSLTTDNTWGYSLSSNSGSTWSNYSGLPIYSSTPKTILETSTQGSRDIQFKIAAKASLGQASGDYSNVINFVAVATPEPEPESEYIMQDVADWESELEIGDEVIATDSRDDKLYYVARLADGNIWMVQNLDYDIVNGGSSINSTNTDVPSNWSGAGQLENTYGSSYTSWNNNNNTPESYDPGDLCWTTDPLLVTCEDYHYHIGNYYNWTAAVAMDDSSSYADYELDVDQSICPAGWKLPYVSIYAPDPVADGPSFTELVQSESLIAGTSGNMHWPPVYFVYGGSWEGNNVSVGSDGSYWSSFVYDADYSHVLFFTSTGTLNTSDSAWRGQGSSIRCVVRP